MATAIAIYEQMDHSSDDFSVKNRLELLKLTTKRKTECKFIEPEIGDIIELSIDERVRHLLVVRVNEKANFTEIFVKEVASGELEKDQLEIDFKRG